MAGEGSTLRLLHQHAVAMDELQVVYTPWLRVPDQVRSAELLAACNGYYGGTLRTGLDTSMDQTVVQDLGEIELTQAETKRYNVGSSYLVVCL